MRTRVFLRSTFLAATMLLGTNAAAGPLDVMQVEYGVATGVLMIDQAGTRSDGLTIAFPVWDYVDNDTYSYQVVQPDTDEASESFVQISPTDRSLGYASAYADTKTLEVGHDSRIGGGGHTGAAVARSNLRIKNNDLIGFINGIDFSFDIPAGSVELVDSSQRFTNVISRVGATIDYVLLSPDPETGGGTFIETKGRLFDLYVDLNEKGELTRSDNAVVTRLVAPPSQIQYRLDPLSGRLRLPGIPPRGELMVFYDMYAISAMAAFETLSSAFLGDPTNLTRDGGFRLVLTEAPDDTEIPAVPEPATLTLLGSGLVAAAGWARARRRHVTIRGPLPSHRCREEERHVQMGTVEGARGPDGG